MPAVDFLKSLNCPGVRLYCAFYIVPVLWLVVESGHYYYWAASALGIVACVVFLSGQSRARTGLACVLSSLTTLGNLPLAISLYFQRSGFNERFFFHFDPSSADIAWTAYRLEVLLVGLYWAAMTAAPLLVAHDRRTTYRPAPRPAIRAAALVGILAYAPAFSLGAYGHARVQALEAPTVIVPRAIHDKPSGTRPNLVFIIAESLEATFGNSELMGEDLTPGLTALEREAVRFSNMIQLPPASWTMGGMVASQCAVPLPLSSRWVEQAAAADRPNDPMNSMTGAIERLLPDEECLGDILNRHGYRNIYLGGTLLSFAGKGAFLATHGFEEQYGWRHLLAEVPDPEAYGPWGAYDDDLFAIAWRRLVALAGESRPFTLMMLTLDTHSVTERDISRSCGRAPLINTQGFTLRCADRLISDFIKRVRTTWPDTVIVLMSDHLAFPNALVDRVASPDARRIRFAVWGPGMEPREIARRGTHFDIGPTVLDILGLDTYRRHNLGASLLAFDSPWLSHDNPQALRVAPAVLPIHVGPGESIVFEKDGPVIRIDGEALVANKRGFVLDDAVFTIRFREDGRFDMVIPWQELDEMEENEAGSLVVGVSSRASFSRAIGGPAEADVVYFAGRLGDEAGLMVGAVDDRTAIRIPKSFLEQRK